MPNHDPLYPRDWNTRRPFASAADHDASLIEARKAEDARKADYARQMAELSERARIEGEATAAAVRAAAKATLVVCPCCAAAGKVTALRAVETMEGLAKVRNSLWSADPRTVETVAALGTGREPAPGSHRVTYAEIGVVEAGSRLADGLKAALGIGQERASKIMEAVRTAAAEAPSVTESVVELPVVTKPKGKAKPAKPAAFTPDGFEIEDDDAPGFMV